MLELVILGIIRVHIGSANAIRRGDLLQMLKLRGYQVDDRKMRMMIENLRTSVPGGAWICTTKNGKGYFYAETEKELVDFLHSESNRGWSVITRVKLQAKRAIPTLAGQFDFPVQETL